MNPITTLKPALILSAVLTYAAAQELGISALTWSIDGKPKITFNSTAGLKYTLLTSDDLTSFSPQQQVTGASGDVQTTVQAQTNGEAKKFFKITCQSQAPVQEWFTQVAGTQEESHGHYILSCSDGGFLQIGESGIIPSTARLMVVKTDANGNLLWKKEYQNGNHNLGNSAIEVSDGYVVAGALGQDSTLLKLNKADGSTLFQKTVNNGGSDAYEHVAQIPTGYVAVGYVNALDTSNTFYTEGQGYMTFFDSSGNKTSGQSINQYLAHGYRIVAYNNELIISGLTEDAQDYALIKTDYSGNLIWNKTFGGSNADHCFGMDLGSDGSIFLTGHTLSGTLNWDSYTMKLDNNGVLLWETKKGNPRGFDPLYIHDETWGVRATPDGGCIISAGTGDEYASYSVNNGTASSDQWEAYVVKMDFLGNVEWEKTFKSPDGQDWAAEDIALSQDGGAVVGIDSGQFGFLKLSPF